MPHLTGIDINAISSVKAWRMVAEQRGMEGIESLLAQAGGGGLGYTWKNQGSVWDMYSAVGDSYDQAHGFFGNTVYALGREAQQTIPVLASLVPVDDNELLPEDPPDEPPDEPPVDDGDWLGAGIRIGIVPGLAGTVAGGREVVSWFGDLITGFRADVNVANTGLTPAGDDGLGAKGQNAVVRLTLGARIKGGGL